MPNGRAFFVELKTKGKTPTPLQQHEYKTDIDYQFYIQEAKNIIKSTGVNHA